jgi:hypothetical protein
VHGSRLSPNLRIPEGRFLISRLREEFLILRFLENIIYLFLFISRGEVIIFLGVRSIRLLISELPESAIYLSAKKGKLVFGLSDAYNSKWW